MSSRVERPDAAVLLSAPTTDCVLVRSIKGSKEMDARLRALRKPGAQPWLVRSGPLIWTLPFKPVQQESGDIGLGRGSDTLPHAFEIGYCAISHQYEFLSSDNDLYYIHN